MPRIFCVIFVAIAMANAYTQIQDVRYTLFSEGKSRSKMSIGSGARTSFDATPTIPIQFQMLLMPSLEIGTKLLFDENDESLDIGGKFLFSNGMHIAFDGFVNFEDFKDAAIVLSYGNRKNTAINFYTDYEVRVGYGDAIVYPDGLFQVAFNFMPTLRFSETFLVSIELNGAGSVAKLSEDFILDLIPRFRVDLGAIALVAEYNIAILLEDNNETNLLAFYAIYKF